MGLEQLDRNQALRPLRESIAGSSSHPCFAIVVQVFVGPEQTPRLEILVWSRACQKLPCQWRVLSDIVRKTGSERGGCLPGVQSRTMVSAVQESRHGEEMSCHEADAFTSCMVGNADVGKDIYTRYQLWRMVGALNNLKCFACACCSCIIATTPVRDLNNAQLRTDWSAQFGDHLRYVTFAIVQ